MQESDKPVLLIVLTIRFCIGAAQKYCEDSLDPFPSPAGHCDTFYECVLYDDLVERQEQHCDDIKCCGNHFSEETLNCVHPDEALCLPELRNLTCNAVGDLLAHPTNCSRYFRCNAALRPTVNECPDNLHFSSQQKMCLPIQEAKCDGMYCNEFDDPMRPTLLPDPENCRAFYKCHNGQPIPMLCPYNLYFSLERDRCEFPFTVDCRNGVRPKR